MQKYILPLAFIFAAFELHAQITRATISQNSILIGEKTTITYSIPLNGNKKPLFKPENGFMTSRSISKNGILSGENSDQLEILSPFKDTIIQAESSRWWIGVYEITAWDSGFYRIEGPSIKLSNATFDFPVIELRADLVKAKKGQAIYDIKESFAEIPMEPFSIKKFTKNYWWMLILLALIIGVIIYIRKKTKKKASEPAKILTLKEQTLEAINTLENLRLWEKQKTKEHFIDLSLLIRTYLSSRFTINLLEKTTYETKLLLQQKGLEDRTIDTIILLLTESDMVKFAKSQPEEIAILKIDQYAREIVAETSQFEIENAE
jgi:sulfur transfer complex TusBCD TusB component (DsrH family)/cbb3-type cytochrome oxidase subunit 3